MPIEKFIVSNDKNIYEAWPDIIMTNSGKLICVFTECNHHGDRNNSRIMMCESTDRGRTWSPKKPFTTRTHSESCFNCSRISKLRDGRLAVICDRVRGGEDNRSEIYVWLGDAEGTKWSDPEVYPSFCGIVPDKLKQLKSGRLIIAAHFKNPMTGKLEQYMWYSDDNGKNWSEKITVAASPDYNLCEVSILECTSGELVAFMRENSRLGHPILKTVSYDNGETWSDIYKTTMDSGHRPVSGFLNDGTVMVTYRYIPLNTQNVFAAFMDESSAISTVREEQKCRIMPLDYDRHIYPDLGYTGWVQFDDGEIYVVNYIKDEYEKAYIRGYSFYPSDVILPGTGTDKRNVF